MLWTEDMDRALYSLRTAHPNATWPQVANAVSRRLNRPISADAANKRYGRILRDIKITEKLSTMQTEALDAGLQGPYTYAGFRIGFFDIETTDLGAMFGRVLTVAVADEFGAVELRSYSDFNGKNILDDAPLIEWAMQELNKYDILVSWNGKLFDKPFLNARGLKGRRTFDFPSVLHIDLMYAFRGQNARFGSSKMDNVAKALGVPHQKTGLDFAIWERAAVGDADALREVEDHCRADVLVLRDIFARSKRLITAITR